MLNNLLKVTVLAGALAAGGCAAGTGGQSVCGNGVIDDGEPCDGRDVGFHTCETQGYGPGVLGCLPGCLFDFSGCGVLGCGNGEIDDVEECDGANLDGNTCVAMGFDGGQLACSPNCFLDTSGCTFVGCGNGIIETGEACDDGNLAVDDGCNSICEIESGWACSGEPSVCTSTCGNDLLDLGEECDGANLGGATCITLGFESGALACGTDCLFDTSQCVAPLCPNGVVDPTEDCEGTDLNGQSCATLGFSAGTLSCTLQCEFNTSQCTTCGDDIIEAGESCDGSNLNNQTCVSQGFSSGTISCDTNTCQFDTSQCVGPICGDANIDPGEACDGLNLNGATCQTQGFQTGTLACTPACQFDTSGCSGASCTNVVNVIGCGGFASSTLLLAFNQISTYSCGFNAPGADEIWSFTPTNSGTASVTLTVIWNDFLFGDDIDLGVLSPGCDGTSCVGYSANGTGQSEFLSIPVVAGQTYYAVAELWALGLLGFGDYTLQVTCP